jgi:RNA polymerase sigma factor for flagellar operon FliA
MIMQAAAQAYNQVALQSRRDELILAHLWLVRHVIGKLIVQLPAGTDVENLESAGTLGLVEAASHFDPDRGIQFKTFAFNRIRGAVLDEMRRNCPLPQQALQRLALVRKAYAQLSHPVSVDALAAATGLTSDEVADCLAGLRLTRMVSWENAVDTIAARSDQGQQRPSAAMEQTEQTNLLTQAIQDLPERERLVVTLYYLEDLRLKEIGQVLDLSESRVSRILNAALFHLNEFMCVREEK